MKAHDKKDIVGIFTMNVIKNGQVIKCVNEKNLVVNGGRNALAALIGGSGGTDKPVTKIGFGTGTTAAALTDDELTGLFDKAIDSVIYPQTGAVSFEWALDYAENNGVDITEFGLLCDDDTLFSRKVRDAITKTSAIRLEGIWTIQF
jgi:hypothetical protein